MLRHAIIHLPNGQVMMTFVDVTDSVNVERALKDKNEALQKSDQLKNDFVQHVSYELRSPLTNIIGFTELLQIPDTGPLTQRQSEYVDHIGSSSSVLLTIVNDILDLATVDAGIMELDLGEVRVEQTIANAVELVAERLREHGIGVRVEASRAPTSFRGDENRVRQMLFNLLSNAANYAPEGSEIVLSCEQTADGRRLPRARRRAGHAERNPRQRLSPLRAALQWRAAARRRPWAGHRQELRRAAWRDRRDRQRAGQGHHRHLPVSVAAGRRPSSSGGVARFRDGDRTRPAG